MDRADSNPDGRLTDKDANHYAISPPLFVSVNLDTKSCRNISVQVAIFIHLLICTIKVLHLKRDSFWQQHGLFASEK